MEAFSGSGSGSGSGPNSSSGSPLVSFETSGTQIPESTGCMTNVTLGVFLSGPSTQTVSVYATTSDGSATAGTDYTAENEQVIFQPGQTVQTISIPILDDGTDEDAGSSQYFYVTLNNPSGATLGTPNVCQVNIAENPPQQATDVLVWNPCKGSKDLASDPTNWYDVRLGQNLTAGMMGPNPSSPIIFDANPADTPNNNAPIIWDKNETVASITLKQYNSQQTINPNVTVESLGTKGSSLTMDGTSWLKMNFGIGNTKFKIDNGGTITNMQLNGYYLGKIEFAGGTTAMAQAPGYTETLGVMFTVDKGANVGYWSNNTLQLTADKIRIEVDGTMAFDYGQNNGQPQSTTLIGGGAALPNDYIDVEGGTLAYYGRQNIKDTITIPIHVSSGLNGGLFTVSADLTSTKPSLGWLVVQGANASTSNVSVDVNGNSTVSLNLAATLECDSGFNAVYGTLQTDSSPFCTLQAGANSDGTVAIGSSSTVIINQPNAGYSKLNVNAATLNLYGQLVLGIDAKNPPTCDLLNVSGTTNLSATDSTLKVYDNNGPPAAGQGPWVIITDGPNKNITGAFKSVTTVPQANLTAQVDPQNPTRYIIKS